MNQRQSIENAIAFGRLAPDAGSYTIARDYMRVRVLSRRLSRYDTDECNGTLAEGAYDKVVASISKSLSKVLDPLGLSWYHQTDPRGCAVYVAQQKLTNENYTHGLPII